MLDGWFAGLGPGNTDDVKSGGVLQEAMVSQPAQRQTSQTALLVRVDGFKRLAGLLTLARLYLDKDDGLSIDGHQVNLASPGLLRASDDLVALSFQVLCGGSLAAQAQGRGPARNTQPGQ